MFSNSMPVAMLWWTCKTCHRRDEDIQLYSRQLHAYAFCLENPAPGALRLAPIERLGLLVFEPDLFLNVCSLRGALSGLFSWIEIRRDHRSFLDFLGRVVTLLDRPSVPEPALDCPWCRYLLAG